MDETDHGMALIARNRHLLAEAEAARLRAQEAVERAAERVRRAQFARLAGAAQRQMVAPAFNLRTTR